MTATMCAIRRRALIQARLKGSFSITTHHQRVIAYCFARGLDPVKPVRVPDLYRRYVA